MEVHYSSRGFLFCICNGIAPMKVKKGCNVTFSLFFICITIEVILISLVVAFMVYYLYASRGFLFCICNGIAPMKVKKGCNGTFSLFFICVTVEVILISLVVSFTVYNL